MIRFRTGFAPGTIDRLQRQIAEQVDNEAERVARRAAEMMLTEARITATQEKKGYEKVGKVKPDPRRSFADLIDAGVEHTSEGWRAYLKEVDDATPEEVAKFAAIERGSEAHQIKAKRAQYLTGWKWQGESKFNRYKDERQVFTPVVKHPGTDPKNILRRARDRVYQRIRRGTV